MLDKCIDQGDIPDGHIVVAACKDDCVTKLSEKGKLWFENMGSKDILKLKYRCGFAFIGIFGGKSSKKPIEIVSKSKVDSVTISQVFELSVKKVKKVTKNPRRNLQAVHSLFQKNDGFLKDGFEGPIK